MSTIAIGKVLAKNDFGRKFTGGHQAGSYIPKDPPTLDFFPELDPAIKNPRVTLDFKYDRDGTHYSFDFVYFNNKHHEPSGTRDEYRLTKMSKSGFWKHSDMQPGQTLILYREDGQYYVSDAPPPGGLTPPGQNWAVVKTS